MLMDVAVVSIFGCYNSGIMRNLELLVFTDICVYLIAFASILQAGCWLYEVLCWHPKHRQALDH